MSEIKKELDSFDEEYFKLQIIFDKSNLIKFILKLINGEIII